MNRTRHRLGIGHLADKKIVLYHGALEEARGTLEVIAAFAEAFRDRSDVVLLIVGEGSAKALIEQEINRGRMENCHLMNTVPYSTVPQLISACDVGLVTFPDHEWWRYQCPTRLVELLAMNKRVVASDLPGIRWAAHNSKLVTYVRSLDVDEVRIAIEVALEETDAGISPVDRSITEMFTSRHLASRLDSILRQRQVRKLGVVGT